MKRTYYIVLLVVATMFVACGNGGNFSGVANGKRVVAKVDDKELMVRDILADMPEGLTGIDSATFVRMYTDNWVLNQLKLSRAEEVLTSHKDIDRLVEDYRQSLIIRQLDQYYVDKEIETEITSRQIAAHYRLHSSQFKLDHDKVRGVIVRVPDNFRNTSALNEALRNVKGDGMVELNAFVEKHSLQITDLSASWVLFSDFLSYLPTVRTRSYDNLLQTGKVQSMKSDDVIFYFTITDVVRKGSTAPLETVEEDIRRMLYAERSSDIVKNYEQELKYEAVQSGRVSVDDSVLMEAMSNRPKMGDKSLEIKEATDVVEEEDVAPKREKKEEKEEKGDKSEKSEKKSEGEESKSDKKSEKKSEEKSDNKESEPKESKPEQEPKESAPVELPKAEVEKPAEKPAAESEAAAE